MGYFNVGIGMYLDFGEKFTSEARFYAVSKPAQRLGHELAPPTIDTSRDMLLLKHNEI